MVSPLLLAELERVLGYPKIRSRVNTTEAAAFRALLTQTVTIIDDPVKPPSLSTADPHDDYLVALAEAAHAVILTGNKHLLGMAGQLPVCSPASFRQLLDT
jgi:predicted nucleic acid-binding protein